MTFRTAAMLGSLFVAALPALTACGGGCARIGYLKDGAPPEEGQALLATAMETAARENPLPPYAPEDPEAVRLARAAMERRFTTADAIMRAEGWDRVELPVDCKTGEPIAGEPVRK